MSTSTDWEFRVERQQQPQAIHFQSNIGLGHDPLPQKFERFQREITSAFNKYKKILSHFPSITESSIEKCLGFVSYNIKSDNYHLMISGEIDSEGLKEYQERVEFINHSFVLKICGICERYGVYTTRDQINRKYEGFLSVMMLLSLKNYIEAINEIESSGSQQKEAFLEQARAFVNDYLDRLTFSYRKNHSSIQDPSQKKQRNIDDFIDDILLYARMSLRQSI